MGNVTVNMCKAKARFSKLVDQVVSGGDVIIARRGRPVARITQLTQPKRKIRFGVLKGKVKLARGFDAPLPKNVLTEFVG